MNIPIDTAAFGLSVLGNHLLRYQEIAPATNGNTVTNYETTERGSPDQAYARFKGTGITDWTLGPVNASFTGRYISAVTEIQGGDPLGSRFYGDVQLQFRPGWMNRRVALTVGVNHVLNNDPPA